MEYLFDLLVGELVVVGQLESAYVLRLELACSRDEGDDEEHVGCAVIKCFVYHSLKIKVKSTDEIKAVF